MGEGEGMVYSNCDSRTKGTLSIPVERLRFLRELEERVRREREARRAARSPRLSRVAG